jgi:two-component system, response regulator
MNNFDVVDILIVEDNPNDLELTFRALKAANLTNKIFSVEDGAEALDFLFCREKFAIRNIQYPPKVVLLDLKLPKVSGLEVLKVVKSDPRTSFIPVVAVTSSNQDLDMKEAYKLGVNSYVLKPVVFDDFVKAMSNLGLYWLLINKPLAY